MLNRKWLSVQQEIMCSTGNYYVLNWKLCAQLEIIGVLNGKLGAQLDIIGVLNGKVFLVLHGKVMVCIL